MVEDRIRIAKEFVYRMAEEDSDPFERVENELRAILDSRIQNDEIQPEAYEDLTKILSDRDLEGDYARSLWNNELANTRDNELGMQPSIFEPHQAKDAVNRLRRDDEGAIQDRKAEALAKGVENNTIGKDGATNGQESKPDQGPEQTGDVPHERSGSSGAELPSGTGSGSDSETGDGVSRKPRSRNSTPEEDRQEISGDTQPSDGDGERPGPVSRGSSAAGHTVHSGTRSGVVQPFRVDRDELKATNLSTEAGKKRAAKGNLEAIRTLKKLQAEGRLDQATPAEQKILSRWVGWGALGKAVDYAMAKNYESYERYGADATRYMSEEARKWGEEWLEIHKQIRDEIGEEGLRKAKASTINAHYTAPDVVSSIWGMLTERFGFKGGAILEPSAGSGLFFGLMPEAVRSQSSLTGVELEP
ncbi:MAG TPA: hypothetical protein PKO12_10150, partial [Holophaga sp.]|nr:hypothetical protein [Holophaga sp.]